MRGTFGDPLYPDKKAPSLFSGRSQPLAVPRPRAHTGASLPFLPVNGAALIGANSCHFRRSFQESLKLIFSGVRTPGRHRHLRLERQNSCVSCTARTEHVQWLYCEWETRRVWLPGQEERKPQAVFGQTCCFYFPSESKGTHSESCQLTGAARRKLKARPEHTGARTIPGGRRGGCSRRSEGPVGWPSKGAAQIPQVCGHPRPFPWSHDHRICFRLSSVPRGVYQEGPLAAPCYGSPFGGGRTGPRGTAVRSSEQAAVFPTDTQTPVFLVK